MGESERQVLPRWHAATDTARLGELGNPRGNISLVDHQLADLLDKEQEWTQVPTLPRASDFVAAAMLALQPQRSADAAAFIIRTAPSDALTVELAQRNFELLAHTGQADAGGEPFDPDGNPSTAIAALKRRVRLDPRNAAAWSDMALQYSMLGQAKNAARAMQIAVVLAPDSRLILRSATRLLVHADDAEQAHRLLTRSSRLGKDPWITAAEIAVAPLAQRQPRSVKAARTLLADDSINPFHTTELASALATLELNGGESKKARRLFEAALKVPNENSLAQAEWASHRIHGLEIKNQVFGEPSAFEARARFFYDIQDWEHAVVEAWGWLADQPFAVEPATFGSCVAEMGLRDFQRAMLFATRGLTANPGNPILLNNLAFAHIEAGQLDAAEKALSQLPAMNMDDVAAVTCRATQGLLAYRKGERKRGLTYYREAIDAAKRLKLSEREAMARVMLAREEWRLDGRNALPLVAEAIESAKGYPDALLQLCLGLLLTTASEGVTTSQAQTSAL